MKIVIPMAGRGSRFAVAADKNPEYKKPKPIINVNGRPMVTWALQSLPFVQLPFRKTETKFTVNPSDLIFIALQEHEDTHGITSVLKDSFGQAVTVILIPEVTRGAVETVMKAKDYIDPEGELIVSDSDHFFDGETLYEMINNKADDVAGIIPVFSPPDDDPKWSYTLFDEDKTAIDINEKDAELAAKGAYANIGAYYFAKGKVFTDEAQKMIDEDDMYGAEGKKEFYVAPLYRRLLKNGMKIKAAVTPQVWGLGTPADYEYFIENYKG